MAPRDILKKKSLLIITGCAVVAVLIFIGARELELRYARSNAATSYTGVLAEIQESTSTQEIYAFAEEAGLTVSSSSAQDGSIMDTVTSILITDPNSGTVLAAVQEYDDLLSVPSSTPAAIPPPAPFGFSESTSTTSTIQFSWSEWPGASVGGYDVYRNGKLIGTSPSVTFTDKGLSKATGYVYGVAAYGADGNLSAIATTTMWTLNSLSSSFPEPVSQTVPQVSGLTASVTNGNNVKLSWKETNSSKYAYLIYRTASSGCTALRQNLINDSDGDFVTGVGDGYSWNATEYVDNGSFNEDDKTAELLPGTYYYCVQAYLPVTGIAGGTPLVGPLSSQVSATVTHAASLPLPPPSVSISRVTTSSISLSIALPNNSNALSFVPPNYNPKYAGYNIYRQIYQDNYGYVGSKKLIATIAQSPSATSTTFTDTGLSVLGMGGGVTPGQQLYAYFVSAYDSAGNTSILSSVEWANPVPQMPSQVAGLTASVSGGSVMLTWQGTAMGAVYNIFRATTPGTCKTFASTLSNNGAIINFAPQINGNYIGSSGADYFVDNPGSGSYYYCVLPSLEDGVDANTTETSYGPVSQEISVAITSPTAPPPSVPTNLSITGISASTISFSWTPSTDSHGTVAGYEVYRDGAQIKKINGMTFTDTGLTPYAVHTYAVAAYDTAGNTSLQSWNASAMAAPLPSKVGGMSATSSGNTVNLSWQPATATGANNSIYAYFLYRATSSACSVQSALVTETSTLSWTDTNLPLGTYYYCAAGQDQYGMVGPLSASAKAIVTASTPPASSTPSVPANLSITTTTALSISLSWSASTETGGTIAGYKVYRNSTQVGTTTAASFTDTGLAASTTYSYAVASYDKNGIVSSQSSSVKGTTNGAATTTSTSSKASATTSVQKTSFLDNLFAPNVACAQTTPGGGSTVVGNNTGQMADCSIAGSNGSANVLVYPNGQLYGVSGNYQFDVNDQGSNDNVAALNAAATAGDNEIQALGGVSVLANPNNNLITLVINGDPTTNLLASGMNANGAALSISTWQPGGTYQNSCAASLFMGNIGNSVSVSGGDYANYIIYVENAAAHEIGHCLGLGHNADPNNVMYGNFLSITALQTFSPAQIQYLKDRAAGKTIQVDPGSCEQACKTGKGFVVEISSTSCVSQKTLCGNQPGTIWDPQTQTCNACAAGSYADQTIGECVSDEYCTPTSSAYDLATGQCGDSLPDEQCSVNNEGVNQCTYSSTGVTCNCDSGYSTGGAQTGGGFIRCTDSNGSAVGAPAGACEGGCQGGQVQLANGSCVPDCDEDPDNPACNSCTDGLTQLPDGSCVTQACANNPSDPSCVNDVCTLYPDTQGCPDYCANNPSDPECGGGDGGDGGGD
jgi:chitodextrinase